MATATAQLHRPGCGRPDCCSRPARTLLAGQVALAYGLPTALVLAGAGLAGAVGLATATSALVVLLALVLAARLAGALDVRRRRD